MDRCDAAKHVKESSAHTTQPTAQWTPEPFQLPTSVESSAVLWSSGLVSEWIWVESMAYASPDSHSATDCGAALLLTGWEQWLWHYRWQWFACKWVSLIWYPCRDCARHELREIQDTCNFSRCTILLGPYIHICCALGTWLAERTYRFLSQLE